MSNDEILDPAADRLLVKTSTGGATWYVVRAQAGRAGFRVAEGLEHGKRWLAEREAADISERLGLRVEILPL